MTINEHEYAKLFTGTIVKSEFCEEDGLQTIHLDDGCMIQIEDGKMRLYNSGGAMLLPEAAKPRAKKLVVTEEVTVTYEFDITEVDAGLRDAVEDLVEGERGDADSALKDWFCNLEPGDFLENRKHETVNDRYVEAKP